MTSTKPQPSVCLANETSPATAATALTEALAAAVPAPALAPLPTSELAAASAPPGDGDWDLINEASKGQEIALGGEGVLKVRLTWDSYRELRSGAARGGALPDLDIAALCFSADGALVDAVYFNNTAGLKRAVILNSGDQSAGGVGEEISVRLLSMLPNTKVVAFVVTSSNDVPLTSVEGTVVSAALTSVPERHPFSCDHITWQQPRSPTAPRAAYSTAVAVPLYVYRTAGRQEHWCLHVLDETLNGVRTFVEALPSIRRLCNLPSSGTTRFQAPLKLTKNEQIVLNAQSDVQGVIRVGCGWDPSELGRPPIDVDLSAFCIGGSNGRTLEQLVYWAKLSAFGDAVIHSGDNQTGDGEGDDEAITVTLPKLPLSVQSVVFVISSYQRKRKEEGDDGSVADLSAIQNAHFSVVRTSDGAELVRFDSFGDSAVGSRSLIMCSLSRLRSPDGVLSDTFWSVTNHCSRCPGGPLGVLDPAALEAILSCLRSDPTPTSGPLRQVNLRTAQLHTKLAPQAAKSAAVKSDATGSHSPDRSFRAQLAQAAAQGVLLKVATVLLVLLIGYLIIRWQGSGTTSPQAPRGPKFGFNRR